MILADTVPPFDTPGPQLATGAAEIWLYALELAHGHYYVGQSSHLDQRIEAHMTGQGSAWTKQHPYQRELVREPTGTSDWKIAEALENTWTLELMKLHGWEKVRGGFWCNTCPVQTRKGLLAHGHAQLVGEPALPDEVAIAPEVELFSRPAPPVQVVYRKRRTLVRDDAPI